MRILVTGANGFLGRGLSARLAEAYPDASRLVLTDRELPPTFGSGIECIAGNLADPDVLAALLEPGFDLVFHLASIPGSLAEREQDLGRRVNLLAPIELASQVAARRPGARFVFASSIAVYGALNGQTVTEATPLAPAITYGAHKHMMETLLSDMTRQKALSALSIRFPGIVARPPTESGHGSAFMSLIFHRIAAGEDYQCPVPAESTCWWMSRAAAIKTLLHAAKIGDEVAGVVQPPALYACIGDVAAATAGVNGRQMRISWGHDEALRQLFGAMPPLDASRALSLGFRADANLETLAKAALSGDSP
jgi:D-erythronate 2-dehydrogenase